MSGARTRPGRKKRIPLTTASALLRISATAGSGEKNHAGETDILGLARCRSRTPPVRSDRHRRSVRVSRYKTAPEYRRFRTMSGMANASFALGMVAHRGQTDGDEGRATRRTPVAGAACRSQALVDASPEARPEPADGALWPRTVSTMAYSWRRRGASLAINPAIRET